jgi:hypothetical protein
MNQRESISIKKTYKGVWMKKFDNYETRYFRCSKNDAMETINNARERGDVFCEGNENSRHTEVWGIWN